MARTKQDPSSMPRREFLKLSVGTVGAIGATSGVAAQAAARSKDDARGGQGGKPDTRTKFNGSIRVSISNRVAFPLGGIGAGMVVSKAPALAFLAAPQTGSVQRAARVRGDFVKEQAYASPRARRAGARVEAVRRGRHRQRGDVVRVAAVRARGRSCHGSRSRP